MNMTSETHKTGDPGNLLEAHHLVKRYGDREVVKGVDLTVAPGEVVAVIGPNGAGKSTTLEIILGLRIPDAGSVTFGFKQPRRSIGIQLQTTPFMRSLTTAENLQLFAHFYGVQLNQQQIHGILERCGLAKEARTEASKLSGGQQKRLAIALTLSHDPRLIFLDEPTASLDPRARHEIRTLILSLATNGTSIVFTSHDMEEVNKLAHRVVLIVEGLVKAEGTPAELLTRFHVNSLEELYLSLTTQED